VTRKRPIARCRPGLRARAAAAEEKAVRPVRRSHLAVREPAVRPRTPPGLVIGGTLACFAAIALVLSARSGAEVVQHGGIRVTFNGELTPRTLPRTTPASVRVAVGAKIAAADGEPPPQLRRITIAINGNGHFEPAGLPVCNLRQIQPSTTADALAACRSSLVGEGQFSANVLLTQQAPFPSEGKIYAFNSRLDGHPAILAHVYGTKPVPTSFTLPFELRPSKGTFGTVLAASLPQVTASSAYVTGLSLTLGRNFTAGGQKRSYLTAACPAPKGFPGATFPFARASFSFVGGQSLGSTLTRNCKARG
jgi:hypothetical protein